MSDLKARRKKVLEMVDLRKSLESDISRLQLQSIQNDYFLLNAVKGLYSNSALGTSMLYSVTDDAIKFIKGKNDEGKIDKRKKSPERDSYNQLIATLEIMMGLGIGRGNIESIRDIWWYGMNKEKVQYYFYMKDDPTHTEFKISIPVFKFSNFCPTVNGSIPMTFEEYYHTHSSLGLMLSNIKTTLLTVDDRKDHYMKVSTIAEFPSFDSDILSIEDFGKIIREKIGLKRTDGMDEDGHVVPLSSVGKEE